MVESPSIALGECFVGKARVSSESNDGSITLILRIASPHDGTIGTIGARRLRATTVVGHEARAKILRRLALVKDIDLRPDSLGEANGPRPALRGPKPIDRDHNLARSLDVIRVREVIKEISVHGSLGPLVSRSVAVSRVVGVIEGRRFPRASRVSLGLVILVESIPNP
jgi:hypothetical protein